jgi:alpha-2-macroglobulin
MTISYFSIDGKPLDVNNLKQGVDFTAEIKIVNPGLMGDYNNMALSFTVPSGWEIINKRLHDIQTLKSESPFTYRDIRDDRVDTFFDLGANKTATFRIELNAAYSGKFYHPAVSCNAMYDNSIFAIEKGMWINVTR